MGYSKTLSVGISSGVKSNAALPSIWSRKSQPITNVFNEEEIKCQEKIEQKLIKTEATTNPNSPQVLAWASWIIGGLGGWKGNPKQRPPGPIILLKSIEKFENIYEEWKLASNYT